MMKAFCLLLQKADNIFEKGQIFLFHLLIVVCLFCVYFVCFQIVFNILLFCLYISDCHIKFPNNCIIILQTLIQYVIYLYFGIQPIYCLMELMDIDTTPESGSAQHSSLAKL